MSPASLATRPQQAREQVCSLWQQGKCTAGSACLFAHAPKPPEPDDAPRVAGGSGSSSRSSRQSWADQSEEGDEELGAALHAGVDRGAFAALASGTGRRLQAQAWLPTEGFQGVCHAWQRGCCTAGSSCLFLHDAGPRPAVLEHSSDFSSSQTWTAWSGQSQSQDGLELAPGASGGLSAGEPAPGHHWVWGSSHSRSCSSSASQSRSSAWGAAPGRRAPQAHGAADLPSFNDRVDLPEFVPGPDGPRDRGPLPQPHAPQPPASRSAKRRRERKNNEKRRDMRALNEVMLRRVVETLASLSLARTDEARRRMFSYSPPPELADSPEAAVPPPTPRWKVERAQKPGEEDDLDGADSQYSYGDR